MTELGEFFALIRKLSSPKPSPGYLALKGCARDCGISDSSLRHYIAGTYIPRPDFVPRMRKWLREARSAARRDGYID